MKNILCLSGLFLLLISGISCNDDFLSKNKENLYTLSDTVYLNNNQENVDISLQLPLLTNSDYTVFMQPKWVSFNSMHGKITSGSAPLSFSILKDNITTGYQTQYGKIILSVDDVGLISFLIAYSNFGSPTIQCSASSLNFESSSNQTFTISNTSEGILNWKITGIPDWLIISVSSGSLNKGYSTTITASLNLENITPGQDLSGTILINSNSTTGDFNIAVHVSAKAIIPSEVRNINGIVTDAEYNHESGIMAICTKSPNSLILFNTKTNETSTISLSKTPNCISFSEDGHKAAVGYSVSSLSYIDIDNMVITKDYTIDCIPYDIVLGNNNWCYITPTADQWTYFRSLNLNSGELTVGTNWSTLYEKTIIKKIPGKPYLVGSRTTLSPTGILIFDVTKGIASDTISYYHTSIGKFWLSEDGTKLYDSYKDVYALPQYDILYHTSSPPVWGQIESELNNISAFDECTAINSIFVTSHDYISGYSSLIEQFNTTNLNSIKTFNVSPVYLTENGIKTLYETNAIYIFVNKEGSVLYILKNLKESYNKDYWTIETFHLGKSGKSATVLQNFTKTK
jgi:hypothetical protein